MKAPTVQGLSGLTVRPQAIMVGIGLRGRHGMTLGIPYDIIGLLLAARTVRDAFGDLPLIIVLGDAQAEETGVRSVIVAYWVRRWLRALRCLSVALDLSPVEIVRSHALARDPVHQRACVALAQRLPADASRYCTLQAADTITLQRRYGALIKVGWAMGRSVAWSHFDETGFDYPLHASSMPWASPGRLGFVYTGPGRGFLDEAPRRVPYVVSAPGARLLLDADEDPAAKIAHAREAASTPTLQGALRHLKSITRLYSRLVRPLRGPLEDQLSTILEDVHAAAPTAVSLRIRR